MVSLWGDLRVQSILCKRTTSLNLYDYIDYSSDGYVRSISRSSVSFKGEQYVNAGAVLLASNSILSYTPHIPCSLEHDLLPAIISDIPLKMITNPGLSIDIGLPETLTAATSLLPVI